MEKLLKEMKCIGCEGGIEPLSKERAKELLQQVAQWQLAADNKTISRTFIFKGFGKTMSFVNAVAWIANQEGHHPDMQVSFDRCTVNFTTHAVQGVTDNDFICAAKVDNLFL